MIKPFCRRCLLEDIPGGAALAANIRELIDRLPEEQRAEERLRAKRLTACRECRHLLDGMCALCGCYVELRASKAAGRCPDLPSRWPENGNL